MPKAKKICKVCGASYEACHTLKRDADPFRWQDVACSPECGGEYFRRVMESRKPVTKQKRTKAVAPEKKAVECVAAAEAAESAENTEE